MLHVRHAIEDVQQVMSGMDSMQKMQEVETLKEGIFVMPKERITIFSTLVYFVADPQDTLGTAWSFEDCGTTCASVQLAHAVIVSAVYQCAQAAFRVIPSNDARQAA